MHLIVDNYATHKHPDVQRWLARHQRFHLHFTPTSSSWLNLVERWFRELTDKALRRGSFNSVPDLIAAIEDYLAAHNDDPKPSNGPPPPTRSWRRYAGPSRARKRQSMMGHTTSEASLGPPRWVAGLGAIVAVGCWLRSGPSLPSADRGVAARLCACQERLGRRGCRSWLRR